jgi:hypothetical protein
MKSAYPKLVAGIFMFALLGLASGAAVGLFLFFASLPMAQLLPDPSTVSQFAAVVAAFAGILTAAVVVALGSASWKKRLEAELYRAHQPNFYAAPAPPPPRLRRAPPPVVRRPARGQR